MNGNEHDENIERDTLHAKLCAVIFGEADEATRAEVERELAASPELRAEREQLEATIGLVRGAMAGEEQLSPQVEAALAAAADAKSRALAHRSGHRPWYSAPVWRIAALLAVLAGVWAASEGLQRDAGPVAHLAVVLKEDLDERTRRDGIDGVETASLQQMEGRVESSVDALSPAEASGEAPALQAADKSALILTEKELEAWRRVSQRDAFSMTKPTEFELADEAAKAREQSIALNPAQEKAPGPFVGLALKESQEGGESKLGRSFDAAPAQTPPVTGSTLHSRAAPAAKAAGGAGGTGGLNNLKSLADRPDAVPDFYSDSPFESNDFNDVIGIGGGEGGKFGGRFGGRNPLPDRGDTANQRSALGELGYAYDDDEDEILEAWARELNAGGVRLRTSADVERLYLQMLESCRRRPQERPRDMFYRYWGDNAFELSALDKLSTFSIDVDTASYTLARRYLMEGRLPEKAQVRTEEFVNYFRGDVPAPTEQPFAIQTELAPSLFGARPDHWMLRVAVRGREVQRAQRQPLALTFVIDVSGSMAQENRLELVKHSLRLLVGELDARDSIALVAFSTEARLILPMTSAGQRALIEAGLQPLAANGGTNTEAGLRMGYEQALAALTENAHNRVVLLSDGVANIGQTDPAVMTAAVERHRQAGIYLNTIGVGMGNHNDALLEQLADKGDGVCNYVDSPKEARRAFVDNFTGAFEPIARDVKIQVEFDPAQVESYRLLGYENRAIADQDFRNDKVDAGEVGAGHQVVALYELVRTGSASEGSLATVRLRYKPPHARGIAGAATEEALELAHPVRAGDAAASFAATNAGYRRSVLVAQFAEFLRRSVHARGDKLDTLIAEATKLSAELKDAEFAEFVELVQRSHAIVTVELARHQSDIDACLLRLREHCWRHAQLEDLGTASERLREFDQARANLEAELRRLLEKRLEATPRVR